MKPCNAWLAVVFAVACAPIDGPTGSSALATTLGAPISVTPSGPPTINDTYNTQVAFQGGMPNVPGGGIHLGTFTFGSPRQVGFLATDGTFALRNWAPSSAAWPPPINWPGGGGPPFAGYVDNAQVFSLPSVTGNIQGRGTFVVVVGVADGWSNGAQSGVAIIVTNDGGQTWGPPQLVEDVQNCGGTGCNDFSTFYAQLDDPGLPSPTLYISYWSPYQYDPHAPTGFHIQRWVLPTTAPFNQFNFKDELPYLCSTMPYCGGEYQYFRFAVGKCASAGGTCHAGDWVVVGQVPNNNEYACPGITRDVQWNVQALRIGDTSWTNMTPSGPLVDDTQHPDCLDGAYVNHLESAIIFDPVQNTIVSAIPAFQPDAHDGNPFGMRVKMFQFAPFNMSLHPIGFWTLSEDFSAWSDWTSGRPPDTELDDILPHLLFTYNPDTGMETFGMDFVSNSDNVHNFGVHDFGGVRIIAVNSGAILPFALPPASGAGVLPSYNAGTDPHYKTFARAIGVDTVSCGQYASFYADPNGPFWFVPFSY